MRKTKKMLLLLLLAMTAMGMEAKPEKQAHVYIFGFSASFKDSVVYMTEIQDLTGAWMDSKTKFLLGRDNYSYQLKAHLTEKLQQSDRVCMVFFATDKKKAEKRFQKLRKKYLTPVQKKGKKNKKRDLSRPLSYDVRDISLQEFQFEPVDMSTEQQ